MSVWRDAGFFFLEMIVGQVFVEFPVAGLR